MAIGGGTFTALGGGISDLFAASADRSKAQGDLIEAANYDLAAKYAYQEEQFTKESTAIQGMQAERQMYSSMSQTKADIAGGGFAASGSGLDILAQSASQGRLQQAVIARQGLITEQGFPRAGAVLSEHGSCCRHGGQRGKESSYRSGDRSWARFRCGPRFALDADARRRWWPQPARRWEPILWRLRRRVGHAKARSRRLSGRLRRGRLIRWPAKLKPHLLGIVPVSPQAIAESELTVEQLDRLDHCIAEFNKAG